MEKQTVKLTEKFGRLSKEEMKNINGGYTVVGRLEAKGLCPSGYGIWATGCLPTDTYIYSTGYACLLACI